MPEHPIHGVSVILVPLLLVVPAAVGSDTVTIYPDVVLNTFTPEFKKPIGINLNFFTDDDKFLKPKRRLVEALKEMGVKYLRYPGGDKSDYYFFAYPPYDKVAPHSPQSGPGSNPARPECFNAERTAFNRDVLDFDEYMAICREVGAEPVVVCALDTYVMTPDRLPGATAETRTSTRQQYIENAAEWVRYANIKKAYGVKYWMLGNETWTAYYRDKKGDWYSIPKEKLSQDIIDFSAAMKAIDPTIKVIPNAVDWLLREYVTKAADAYDFVCTSNYPLANAGIKSYADWANDQRDLTSIMESLVNVIDASSLGVDKKRSVTVWAAESGPYSFWQGTWGSGKDVGHALFNFDIMGQQLSNPRFGVSLFWNTRWMGRGVHTFYDAVDDDNNLTPNGQSIALWGNFLLPQMVKTSQLDGLTTYASRDPATGEIYCYVINKTGSKRTIRLQVDGHEARSVVRRAWMKGVCSESQSSIYSLHDSTPLSPDVTLSKYSITVFSLKKGAAAASAQPEPPREAANKPPAANDAATSAPSASQARDGTFAVDANGFIRNWLALPAIPLKADMSAQSKEVCRPVFDKERFDGLKAMKPAEGENVSVDGVAVKWETVQTDGPIWHFKPVDNSLYLAVAYIVCERDMPDLFLSIGSDDSSLWTLNGTEVVRVYAARGAGFDQDMSRPVRLKKGVNVLTMAVVNGSGWAGACARFLDQDLEPVRNMRVGWSVGLPRKR